MADKQINIVIGADINKLEKGFKDAVRIIGASGKTIDSQMEAVVKSIEKDFERIANSPNTKRTVAQLQNLALKVQALGPEFEDMANKIIKSAGQIKDKVSDAGAQIQYFSSDTRRIDAVVSAAHGVAGAFGIAEGAAALFGSKNEELQKTLAKVQGAIALMNGIQAVQNVLQQESAAMTGLNAAAQQVLAIKTYATASAMNALKVAMVATGIGVAIVLVAQFASAMSDAADKSKLLGESIQKANKEAEEAAKAGFESQKNFADRRIGELGKELQAQGKSNIEILNAQMAFIKKQKNLTMQQYLDIKTNQAIKGQLFKEYNDLESQRYGLELDIQIAANEAKKKANDEAIKNEKEFIKLKQDLDKELNKQKPVLSNGSMNSTEPTYEQKGGSLGIAKKQKEDTLKFTESISSDIITAEQNFNDKKFTVDMKAIENTRKILAANQSITDEKIKQREREKQAQDEYIADNDKFVAAFNASFANIQSDAYANIGLAIADGLLNGSNVLQSVFSIMLNSVGAFADAYGKALIAAAVASEAFQKLLISNPVLAIGAGIALVAAGAVVKSIAAKGPTAFADGGIVSGPTLGLVGEYPGASSNPEVIAPLDKLKGMLMPMSGGNFPMSMETRFDGRDLYLAVKKYERDSRRG
jgi:hypothetical protein